MKRAIGIHLAGEQPTAKEQSALVEQADAMFGEGCYSLKRIVAWDIQEKKRIVRLDAWPNEEMAVLV